MNAGAPTNWTGSPCAQESCCDDPRFGRECWVLHNVSVSPIGNITRTGWDTVSVTANVPAIGQVNIITNNRQELAKRGRFSCLP